MTELEVRTEQVAPVRTGLGRVRWGMAAVLGVGMFVNYVDRVNLSIAAPAMMADLHISAVEMGVISSAFLWTYAALQIPIGPAINRIGVRWINRVSAALWGAASFLTAAAGGLGLVLVARLLLGVAEAPSVPAGWTAIGQWFPRAERSTATAIFDGSAKLSNVIGIPVMALLVSSFGWQSAFVLTGVVSLVYLVVWWLCYRSPEESLRRGRLTVEEYDHIRDGAAHDAAHDAVHNTAASTSFRGVGYLLARRKTWGLALGYAGYTYAYYVLLTWLPSYLTRQFGVNLLAGGLYTVIPWVVAVLAQFLVGGLLVDHLVRRTGDVTRVRRTVLVASLVLSLALSGAAYAGNLAVALVCMSVGAAGLAISNPVGASIVSLIAPPNLTAPLGGVVNCIANLIGIAAPIVTGVVYEVTGSFSGAFLLTGMVILGGIASYTLLLGRIEPMPAPPVAA